MSETPATPGEVAEHLDAYVIGLLGTVLKLPTGTPEEITAVHEFLSLAERYAALAVQLGRRHEQLSAPNRPPATTSGP